MTDDNDATDPTELFLHPLRFRILRALAAEELTTQELAERLTDAPKSSIYRHARVLLEAGIITVAGTQMVRGIQEKRYALAGPVEGEAGRPTDAFTTFALALLRGRAADPAPPPALQNEPGYTELSVWASKDEMDRFMTALNGSLRPLMVNGPAAGRSRHTIAFIAKKTK